MGKLEAVIEKLEEVPEELRSYYTEAEDGKFRIQVNGLVPKSTLAEFRNTNTELMKQLASVEEQITLWKVLGEDPTEINKELKELRALRTRVEDKDLIDRRGFDEALNKRTAEMKASTDNQIRTLTEELQRITSERDTAVARYQQSMVNRELTDAALAAGVLPPAIPDVLSRAREHGWILNDKGRVVQRDNDGGTQYVIGADGASPLTPREWLNGYVRDTAPHFFAALSGGGSFGSTSTTGTMENPYEKATWNMTKQGRLEAEDPAKAKLLAAKVGISLNL